LNFYDFDEADYNFDYDINLDVASDLFETDNLNATRIHIPKWKRPAAIKYSNAKKLAQDVELNETTNYFVIVSGSFIFGDFI
jgi:hypothetical protein